jgi:Cu2+-exporting ATPase
VVGDVATAVTILRPDYATGPRLVGALTAVGDVAHCYDHGVVVRDCSALDRLAEADTLVIADHAELRRPELRVVNIESRTTEIDRLIRLGASLGRYLGDERGQALHAACRARNLTLLNLSAVDLSRGVSVRCGRRFVRLCESDDALDDPGDSGPLTLEVEGEPAGTFHFRPAQELAAARAVSELRSGRRLHVTLVSTQREPVATALARALGADECRTGLSEAALVNYLRQCRTEGRRAALVGPGRLVHDAVDDAHVAIALVGDDDLEATGAPLLLLQSGLSRLTDLWNVADGRNTRSREARQITLVPNVFCIAGAFFLGFTSLTAVVISNLATLGNALRASEELRRGVAADGTRRRPLPGLARREPGACALPSEDRPAATVPKTGVDTLVRPAGPVPPELGVLLVSVGCLGVVLPGMIGVPAIVAGGLALWPRAFRPVETWIEHRFPTLHRKSLEQMGRFVADLARRYPSRTELPGGSRG